MLCTTVHDGPAEAEGKLAELQLQLQQQLGEQQEAQRKEYAAKFDSTTAAVANTQRDVQGLSSGLEAMSQRQDADRQASANATQQIAEGLEALQCALLQQAPVRHLRCVNHAVSY